MVVRERILSLLEENVTANLTANQATAADAIWATRGLGQSHALVPRHNSLATATTIRGLGHLCYHNDSGAGKSLLNRGLGNDHDRRQGRRRYRGRCC